TNSAILMPVLSPRFFGSYCEKEVKAFIDAHGLTSGSPHRSRIMPIKLLCGAPSDHILAKLQAANFCSEDRDGIPFEFAAGTPQYKEALRTLAFAVAQVLKNLPPKQRRPTVYVAADFSRSSQRLRASLGHRFDVLPDRPADLPGLSPE